MSCQRRVLVPRSVNLLGKRDNAGHEKTIVNKLVIIVFNIYLVQKETQCFYFQFLGLKIIDFKNCFNSMVLPSNKDLDLHSFVVNWISCSVLSVKF